jgi:hypothetical protein
MTDGRHWSGLRRKRVCIVYLLEDLPALRASGILPGSVVIGTPVPPGPRLRQRLQQAPAGESRACFTPVGSGELRGMAATASRYPPRHPWQARGYPGEYQRLLF